MMPLTQPSSHSSAQLETESPGWVIKLLYDGACPLCLREVDFLQKKDAGRGLVLFVDIARDDYQPAEHGGIDYETAMGRIHAVRADGSIVQNVAVFREVYKALGMGWVYAATQWPVIGPTADFIYGIWAKYRLALTGRSSLEALMAERNLRFQKQQSDCRCDTEI